MKIIKLIFKFFGLKEEFNSIMEVDWHVKFPEEAQKRYNEFIESASEFESKLFKSDCHLGTEIKYLGKAYWITSITRHSELTFDEFYTKELSLDSFAFEYVNFKNQITISMLNSDGIQQDKNFSDIEYFLKLKK